MKFGSFSLDQAQGAILAHAVQLDGTALKKGHVLSAQDIELLHTAGILKVIAAKLSDRKSVV